MSWKVAYVSERLWRRIPREKRQVFLKELRRKDIVKRYAANVFEDLWIRDEKAAKVFQNAIEEATQK